MLARGGNPIRAHAGNAGDRPQDSTMRPIGLWMAAAVRMWWLDNITFGAMGNAKGDPQWTVRNGDTV